MLLGLSVVIAGAFFRIDGQYQHQRRQGIGGILHLDGVGIGPVEDLLADGGDRFAVAAKHGIFPFQPIALYLPAVAIDVIARTEEGKLTGDTAEVLLTNVHLKLRHPREDPLFDRSQLVTERIEDLETMPPSQFALDDVHRFARFVKDIVTVQPRKQTLFK